MERRPSAPPQSLRVYILYLFLACLQIKDLRPTTLHRSHLNEISQMEAEVHTRTVDSAVGYDPSSRGTNYLFR